MQGKTRQGRAGRARQGKASQGKARQGGAGQGKARCYLLRGGWYRSTLARLHPDARFMHGSSVLHDPSASAILPSSTTPPPPRLFHPSRPLLPRSANWAVRSPNCRCHGCEISKSVDRRPSYDGSAVLLKLDPRPEEGRAAEPPLHDDPIAATVNIARARAVAEVAAFSWQNLLKTTTFGTK
jgi:hypothetical protein